MSIELPPLNLDDFKKWKNQTAIVKVRARTELSSQETDMDEIVKIEAKDAVVTGIEKASGAHGINIEVEPTR